MSRVSWECDNMDQDFIAINFLEDGSMRQIIGNVLYDPKFYTVLL